MKSLCLNNIQYVVEKVIGRGSFSIVYGAKDIHNHNNYAIKKVRIKKLKHIPYIENEYNILVDSQDNKHIIKIFDYAKCCLNVIGHVPIRYLVMECGDDTLRNTLVRSSGNNLKNIFYQCSSALRHIHSIGIVHGDIKLDNYIMVGNVVKLVDFGLAFRLNTNTSKKMNRIGGTLKYMSPEAYCVHYGYEMFINMNIDVWSLGVIIYEFVSKRRLISVDFMKCKNPHKTLILEYFESLKLDGICSEYIHIVSACLCVNAIKRCDSEWLCKLLK